MVTPPDNVSLYKSPEGYQQVMAQYDAAFQAMGIPYETRYVETALGPTHAVIWPSGSAKVEKAGA